MRHYENLVIVKPTLTEEETKSQIAAIEEVITANGGEIKICNDMGIRKLAYPIEKSARGYFYVIYFTMEPKNIAEIERRYRINEELLRFVTIKYDSKREVKAWNDLVAKTEKLAKPVAEAPVAPAVEEKAPEAPATEA
ncbi:MAG: 30S ribosomal protein S6 [Campylobacterota bacterium]|nr:30S ribosomal protein S6 [Campylobacterota bacterium]